MKLVRNSASPCFWRQAFKVHRAEAKGPQRFAEGGKIDLRGRFLAVDHALLLHIEGDNGEPGDSRVPRHVAKDRNQGARVQRLERRGERILRREIDHHLYIEGVGRFAGDGGFLLKRFGVGRQHGAGRDVERDLFVLGGQGGVAIPIEGADPLAAVAHQPIDMVFPFTHIEGTGEDGISAGVGIDHGDVPTLREIDRVVGLLIGRHAEDHG